MTDVFQNAPVEVKTEDLVGEGKKFKSVDDLAKGKVQADAYIEQLKAENAEMRIAIGRQSEFERQLNQLRDELKAKESATQPRDNTSPALDENAIKALVAQTITEKEQERSAEVNIAEANDQLVKVLGTVEAARKAVTDRAREMGVSVDFLKGVAEKSPTAFLKIIDVKQTAPPAGSFVTNTAAPLDANIQGGQPAVGTYEYYQNLRRTKGNDYFFAPAIQNQLWEHKLKGVYVIPQT